MPLHITEYEGKPAFLFLDEEERVIELPTEYLRSLVTSPKSLRLAPSSDTLKRFRTFAFS